MHRNLLGPFVLTTAAAFTRNALRVQGVSQSRRVDLRFFDFQSHAFSRRSSSTFQDGVMDEPRFRELNPYAV